MKVSPGTLKTLTAGAIVAGTAGAGIWFCVDQALEARSRPYGAPQIEWAERVGEEILGTWDTVGIQLGLFEEPLRAPCSACGMG